MAFDLNSHDLSLLETYHKRSEPHHIKPTISMNKYIKEQMTVSFAGKCDEENRHPLSLPCSPPKKKLIKQINQSFRNISEKKYTDAPSKSSWCKMR